MLSLSMFLPANPSSAGTNVTDATIITSTVDRASSPQPADEVDAHEEETAQRDHHRRAGEQDRSSRGVDGQDDRALGVEPVMEALGGTA